MIRILGVLCWIACIAFGAFLVYTIDVTSDSAIERSIAEMEYNDIALGLNYTSPHDDFITEISHKCGSTSTKEVCEKVLLKNTFNAYVYGQNTGNEKYNPYITPTHDTTTEARKLALAQRVSSYIIFVLFFFAGMFAYTATEFMAKIL